MNSYEKDLFFLKRIKNGEYTIKGGNLYNTVTKKTYNGKILGKTVEVDGVFTSVTITKSRMMALIRSGKPLSSKSKHVNIKGIPITNISGKKPYFNTKQVKMLREKYGDPSKKFNAKVESDKLNACPATIYRIVLGKNPSYSNINVGFETEALCKVRSQFNFGELSATPKFTNKQVNDFRKDFIVSSDTVASFLKRYSKKHKVSEDAIRRILRADTYNFGCDVTRDCLTQYNLRVRKRASTK
jgi:hypothetical protein